MSSASNKVVAQRWGQMQKKADYRNAITVLFGAHLKYVKNPNMFITDLFDMFNVEFIIEKKNTKTNVDVEIAELGEFYPGYYDHEWGLPTIESIDFKVSWRFPFKDFPAHLYWFHQSNVKDKEGFLAASFDMIGNPRARAKICELYGSPESLAYAAEYYYTDLEEGDYIREESEQHSDFREWKYETREGNFLGFSFYLKPSGNKLAFSSADMKVGPNFFGYDYIGKADVSTSVYEKNIMGKFVRDVGES